MQRGWRFFILILAVLGMLSTQISVRAEGPFYTIRQRFGVNVAPQFGSIPSFPGKITDYPGASELGFGWYSDWGITRDPIQPNGIEYAQLLQTRRWPPNWGTIQQVIAANPGALWLIGNEPDHPGQGNNTPEQYALIYHEAYYFIKNADPSAQVAIGGVVLPSPLRLKWLDLARNHYQVTYSETMPVDVWNTHVQILQEKRGDWGCGIPVGLTENQGRLYEIIDNCNVNAFTQLMDEFRTWLYERGEQDKPVIISEYGVLMPSGYLPQGDESVRAFMQGTFDYMLTRKDPFKGYAADEGRYVQRWLWFSLNFPFWDRTPGGFNGALYDWQHPEQLTVFGEFYRDYVTQHSPTQTPTATPSLTPTPTFTPVPTETPTASATPTPGLTLPPHKLYIPLSVKRWHLENSN
jgi:hypothetical protein